jgi:hypothetical protein
MTVNDLFLSFVTKVFNKSEDELKPLIFDGEEIKDQAFETLVGLDTARVKRLKSESTEKFNNGYSKGKAETAEEFEKTLREHFGISEELPFIELLPKVKEQFSAKSKLTSDDIKMHPEYLALETSRVPKEKYEALSNEFEVYKKTIDRKIKFDKVWERAEPLIESFNADWPSDPKIKSNLKALMKKDFESFEDAEFIDNDIILKKDGKRVEDEHLNPIKFPDITKGILTNYVTLKVQDAKGNAGNQNKPGASNVQGYNFANKTEMIDTYNKITDEKEKKEFLIKTRDIRF